MKRKPSKVAPFILAAHVLFFLFLFLASQCSGCRSSPVTGFWRPNNLGLSLLKSAVSIGCNHIFCKSCILESMKRVSDCPVCKVSFRKRELRPAPHMDNLVTVFKSMEVTSGFNIFTTQVAPSTTNSVLPTDDTDNSDIPKILTAHQGRSKGKKSDNKSKQENEKVNNRTSKHNPAMSHFPAKKRVHVMPYPIYETPLRHEKVSKSRSGGIELEANKNVVENKKVDADNKQESLFPPFFWMRERNEDDDDSLENPSSQDKTGSSQPYNAPCFSDIKDSDDDECPIKMTTTSKCSDADFFDSEMFEWTQRACSPELCSTPPNKKTAGRNKLNNETHGVDCHEMADIGDRLSNEAPPFKSMNSTKSVQAYKNGKTGRVICAKKGSLERRGRPKRRSQTKNSGASIKTSCDSALRETSTEVLVKSGAVKTSSQKKEIVEWMKPPSQENGSCKSYSNGDDLEAQPSKELSTIKSKVLPVSTCDETNSEIAPDMQYYSRKRGRESTFQPKRKQLKESMKETKLKVLEEVPDNIQNQESQKVIAISHVMPSKRTEIFQGHHQDVAKNKVGEFRGKGRRYHAIDTVLDSDAKKVIHASAETGNKNDSSSVATKRVLLRTQFIPNNGDNILRKCGNLQSKVCCAFCRSSDDTEESGEMMYYFDGKPVAADYNGGGKVIHSHRHCTEWAPDVYFEDDVAVNLASELARSRRIKCSCCGIKGAALGCFENNCRKSFHFTCAKLVPECRWDEENFVMLCSLHSSSKLPKEASESWKQKEQRSRPKEKPLKHSISRNSQETSRMWTWPSGSPCKWVICCSALTATEKEIISEFTRLTSVSISKTWSPAVTHVIASTDANGACKRTLKFLMGILDGKWILSIEWIKACIEAMGPVDEEKFEIAVDVHGISDGPRLGRMRVINKEPKIFSNLRFYLSGEFMPSYKGYLQDLITSAGGTVLQRKPITRDQEMLLDNSSKSATIVIYSLELPENRKCSASGLIFECRRAEAQVLADACGAGVATNSWIMDSIAASKLQPLVF